MNEPLLPLLLIGALALLLPRGLFQRIWFQRLAVLCLGALLLRYLVWRYSETVLPADLRTFQGLWVWFIFLVELVTWFDAAVLMVLLTNRTNRSPEADWHEDRLRDRDPAALPVVDVFIATYNEPLSVLERTIAGALAIDWPADRLNVWVLDDGRRDWLEAYTHAQGAGYLTRPDNAGAKAGNINAAVARTEAPFFLVLDADFVAQRNFLYRAMGFFEDPRIGIVQIPHHFFNADPIQASLEMSEVMPDDQKFFFDAIMPGRDGFDCAFCCGSNGIVRREALDAVGGRLPSGSITEDMLLTMAMMRKGYITRYLNERLAFGLAPDNINAFFIQRARWARGALQMLYLPEGPLALGALPWYARIFFLPLHWVTQSVAQPLSVLVPPIFLLTGLLPLLNVDVAGVLSFQIPVIVATILVVRLFATGQYHPLSATALALLQAFRLLPVVLETLVKPRGHAFKVTPKFGSAGAVQDRLTVAVCLGIVLATGLGLFVNIAPGIRIVDQTHLFPVVAMWCIVNICVLLLVAKITTTPPIRRAEVRFILDEPCALHLDGEALPARIVDMSLSGARLILDAPRDFKTVSWIGVEVGEVGVIPARIRWVRKLRTVGLDFALPETCLPEQAVGALRACAAIETPQVVSYATEDGRISGRVTKLLDDLACIEFAARQEDLIAGRWLALEFADEGLNVAEVLEIEGRSDGVTCFVRFTIVATEERERVLRKLFSNARVPMKSNDAGWAIALRMIYGIFREDRSTPVSRPPATSIEEVVPPQWLQDLCFARLMMEPADSAPPERHIRSRTDRWRPIDPAPHRVSEPDDAKTA